MTNPTPNGLCWCDCGGKPQPGSFFLPGHDKRAERYLTTVNCVQDIATRLAAQSYVPGLNSLRTATLAADTSMEECGLLGLDGQPCRVIGRGAGMRKHRATDAQHLH